MRAIPPYGHDPGYLLALNLARRPASLASASACLGVLRRSAPDDARANTPIPCPCRAGRPRYGGSSSVVEAERSRDSESEDSRIGARQGRRSDIEREELPCRGRRSDIEQIPGGAPVRGRRSDTGMIASAAGAYSCPSRRSSYWPRSLAEPRKCSCCRMSAGVEAFTAISATNE